MKNIIIVAHKFLPQPDDDLILYLNHKKYPNALHIYHSFHDSQDRRSTCKWYKKGKLIMEKKTLDYKFLPEPLLYLKEFIYTFVWVLQTGLSWDLFIGMDGMCTDFGLFLRNLRLVHEVVYWAIDFVPQKRFPNEWKNKIYHWINRLGYKYADQMWDLSPRMKMARKKFLGIDEKDYKDWKIVPYGVWTNRIKTYSYIECQKGSLVFMGNLLEKQGVQYVLKSIPSIVKKIPNFHFKIIGTGNYEPALKKLAHQIQIEKYCTFMGKIDSSSDMEIEIAKSALAIAPYDKNLDTWTYYADPGKVKTYLACGVPVLLTDVPWNASSIEKFGCGKVIDLKDIEKEVIAMLAKNNQSLRDKAIKFSKTYDYEEIFDNLF